jgi:hypothetical protein
MLLRWIYISFSLFFYLELVSNDNGLFKVFFLVLKTLRGSMLPR